MANYRTTVILKTDIVNSTSRLAAQTQSEMGLQRKQHKQFIAETANKYHGLIFDQEGDAYWIEFPSVTDAVLASIKMHQSLRSLQTGKSRTQKLSIRAVITVGDILHQGSDTIGTTMSLTARIEKVTPPDEIYLSHAAWLVLNKAEVQTSFVNEFSFSGFGKSEKIFRVDQKHRAHILKDQFIVNTDVRGWMAYTKSKEVEEVENFLMEYDDLLNEICDSYSGVIRTMSGDEYFMTFSEINTLFPAMENLFFSWKGILDKYGLGLSVMIHFGDINIFRSYLFGNDLHVTMFLEQLQRSVRLASTTVSILVSNKVKESAANTIWQGNFQELDVSDINESSLISTYEEYGAHWLIIQDV